VMLCVKDADGLDTETLLTHVVEQIRLRDPAIPIYVSPINGYPPGHDCPTIGARGVDVGRAAVEWGVAHLGVQYGPVTGLPTIDLVAPDQCHLTSSGISHVGTQLVAWFDDHGEPAYRARQVLAGVAAGLTVAEAGWLASANYAGYLAGALSAIRAPI